MTDADIIKALECCTKGNTSDVCVDCPLKTTDICTDVENGLMKLAIDLINRQKAEIERLTINMNAFGLGMKREKERADTAKAEIENLQNDLRIWKDIAHRETSYVEKARAEAIKEFAERLKTKERPTFPLAMVIDVYEIDNLVKEMVGDAE